MQRSMHVSILKWVHIFTDGPWNHMGMCFVCYNVFKYKGSMWSDELIFQPWYSQKDKLLLLYQTQASNSHIVENSTDLSTCIIQICIQILN